MILTIKIVLAFVLILIVIQDFKSQAVYWFLFPLMAIMGVYLFKTVVSWAVFWQAALTNLGLVGLILLCLWAYSKFKLKKPFINTTLGLGDVLFFVAFALSFPTLSFLNFFVFSLLFSVIISLFLKFKSGSNYLPLAGTMALFLLGVYLSNWLGFSPDIYLQ